MLFYQKKYPYKADVPLRIVTKHKPAIDAYLTQILTDYQSNLINRSWSDQVFSYLSQFVSKGKSIRGALLLETAELIQPGLSSSIMPLAALVELMHSGLLIHDDIMDQDDNRRGLPTFHAQFTDVASHKKYKKPHLFGTSLAICVGDIAFFLGIAELAKVNLPPVRLAKLKTFILNEYVDVGLAQMKDVEFGHSSNDFSLDEIEEVYLYKTARYTFSLPLVIGGFCAHLTQSELNHLEKIGELIGIIFQIRDDYLALFGNTQVTGKSVGNDITENKKTIYHHYLFARKHELGKHQQIYPLFGKETITIQELMLIQQAIIDLGIQEIIETKINHYQTLITEILSRSKLKPELQQLLLKITTYVAERDS
jgi:geranylgeranyl diphosphate synthase type I